MFTLNLSIFYLVGAQLDIEEVKVTDFLGDVKYDYNTGDRKRNRRKLIKLLFNTRVSATGLTDPNDLIERLELHF